IVMLTFLQCPNGVTPNAFLKTQKDQERVLWKASWMTSSSCRMLQTESLLHRPAVALPVERASAVSQIVLPAQWLQDYSGRKLPLGSTKSHCTDFLALQPAQL
ncbi:hypothetical protein HispidOSU_007875, partial [Sigmodon hispidus]